MEGRPLLAFNGDTLFTLEQIVHDTTVVTRVHVQPLVTGGCTN